MSEGILSEYSVNEIILPVSILTTAVFTVIIAIAEEMTVLYAGLTIGVGLVVLAGVLSFYRDEARKPTISVVG
ncbi:hypothetical protein [Natronomonas sp. EA1]|uniref:hypothetical protein n=1 Tax=Natronomonas sp. EA1 TaxID=3421655 RepID=UPI003EB74F77